MSMTNNSIRSLSVVVAGFAAAAAVWLASAPAAHACGGFFCSQASPVNQSAEQIVFIHNEEAHEVTAVIQIMYSGPSENFAWLLPVPGTPEPGVSSNVALARLLGQTDPQYNLDVEVEGMCNPQQIFGPFDAASTGGAAGGAAPPPQAPTPDVTVLDEGSVGPYDYTTIMVNPALPDKADVAVEWLTDNGYDVTAIGPDVLRPYLDDGLNLIAFKLQKGTMTGAIRPVVITYDSDLPMIPIRPTRVAAANDMGVLVWMLAQHQAIPKNYKSLLLNEALINWFNWRSTYDEVVSAAADEAGGHGFVTELGGPSSDYDEAIWSANDQQSWESYMATPFVDGFDAIQQAQGRYRSFDGWREAVCGAVTLPDGLDCDTFGRSPTQYQDQVEIDEVGFLTALYEDVVKPVMDTQDLILVQPYLTRMYTTMSPEEMTEDPLFDINSDLGDVDNVHTATQYIECSPDVYQWEAPWRIELPQGGVIRGEGSQLWPIDVATTDLPATTKIVQLSTSGAGEVLQDNREMINLELFDMSGETSEPTMEPPDNGMMIGGGPMSDLTGGMTTDRDPVGTDDPIDDGGSMGSNAAGDGAEASDNSGGGGFCAVGASPSGAGNTFTALLLAFGYLVSRRRRC
jgi:hypothetical protein